MPLCSLRLTVVLFAFSIVLVLAGTLAQIDHDIWYVIHNYFRCWIAFIDLQVFFPRSWNVPGTFPFAGGWLLGTALGINLISAHAFRFKVTASGGQLKWGLFLVVAGVALTYWVVQSGLDDTVESELSPAFRGGLWHGMRFLLGIGTLGLAYWLMQVYPRAKQSSAVWLWWFGAVAAAVLGGLAIWLFMHPDVQLDASGLRILWQLAKATAAGLVLYAGCHWVFGRRAGIVLLHSGIALMMFNELLTGLQAEEAHMRLVKGQTLTYAEDTRSVELAVIDKSSPTQDKVTRIPGWMLTESLQTNKPIDHPALPFTVRVVEYLENASFRGLQPGEEAIANRGAGLLHVASSRVAATGVDQEQRVDIPAAYVELRTRNRPAQTGIYLVTPYMDLVEKNYTEAIDLGDTPFEISMRFRRLHKDYSVTLVKFTHTTYVGSKTPKNYESVVRLKDPARNVDRELKLWMNNPLRYGGDTIYQSGFDPNNDDYTDLQVVTNFGWMIPYVACMIVAIGMLVHFGQTMVKFLRKQEREAEQAVQGRAGNEDGVAADASQPTVGRRGGFVPALVVVCCFAIVLYQAGRSADDADQMQIDQFGKLPIAYGGRVQPMDSFARNTLRALCGKQTFIDTWNRKQPAIRWFLDTISEANSWRDHRVLRIDNLDVLQMFDLDVRKGFCYSFSELSEEAKEFDRQVLLAQTAGQAAEEGGPPLELAQLKVLELKQKINRVFALIDVFSALELGGDSPEEVMLSLRTAQRKVEVLREVGARPVSPSVPGETWENVLTAELHGLYAAIPKIAPAAGNWKKNAASAALLGLVRAYRESETREFNEQLVSYQELIADRAAAEAKYNEKLGSAGHLKPAERLNLSRIGFEAFYNKLSPFLLAMVFYLLAFLLVAMSWLGWTATLNRSAHWLLWFTFALHTYALVCRIYISGRPPVTNLYSSAIFIGWAAVLFGLVLEKIYRGGIGNLLAAVIGFPTLFIAHNLAGDGDTFMVLQAVLDTQFWLATHVVCITLGYATTFLAGMLGVIYVLMAHVVPWLKEADRHQLVRMIYGTLCFATFFSFIGTVLGGLWADDSWGRFWGWDPKENGALMIVIWNVLVLHARWGAMVRQRGLAVLAIFGNVVTAWSWFGVNQMGVGLHAYGFTEGRTLWLCVFALSQLAVMVLGCVPRHVWLPEAWVGPAAGDASRTERS